MAVCLAVLGGSSPVGVAQAAAGQQKLDAVADASVLAAHPYRHLGGAQRLRLAGDPLERSYLRFSLVGVSREITAAKLLLFVRRGRGRFSLQALSTHKWRERRISFKNAPRGMLPVRLKGQARPGRWVAVDVTRFAGARSLLDLLLSTKGGRIQFASRESGRTAPRVRLTMAGLGVFGPQPLPADFTASGGFTSPDTTAPDTYITSGPAGTTKSVSAAFEFSSNEAGSSFECRLDGPGAATGSWTACSSLKGYSGLADGTYTFSVRATDAAGNTDTSEATRRFVVDIAAPSGPVIDSPSDGSFNRTGTVTVSGSAEPNSTVELFDGGTSQGTTAVDGSGGWSKQLTGVSDGLHTYTAKATDAAQNTSGASSPVGVTVDTVAPNTSIGSGPSGVTGSGSPSFSFTTTEPGAGSGFECKLDGPGTATGSWTACSSLKGYSGLADGTYTFSVRATDAAGNTDSTPATRSWTVDTVPPAVSITSPAAGTTYTTAQNVQIVATASPDTARVEYFDDGSLTGTEDSSPFAFSWSVSSADNGTHSWTARATDDAGNVGAVSDPVAVTVNVPGGGGGGGAAITPSAETDPVPHAGDAADDAAVWIHPDDPAKSTIIGTDKLGGLAVYDLSGDQLFYYEDSKPNNVDVRYNFPLDGDHVGLVATSDNSTTKALRVYTVDPATRGLRYPAARTIDTGVAAGLCMYHSPTNGDYYAFISDNSGTVQQWKLFDAGGGKIDATKVRTIRLSSTTEGCVADDETGDLYISQEDVAIWRYGAEPGDGTSSADRTKVDGLAADGGHLTNDIEGLAIYYRDGGAGYLIASSQGSNDYAVYDRGGTNPFVTRFSVVDGTIDGSSYTDGVDVTNFPTAAGFSNGLFVAQDNTNTLPSANQDFKLVPWERIADANGLSIDTSWDPRLVGAPVTYYLDATDGDDSNAGTSPSHPWRTLAKATAAQLQPGERLLLKRGEAWTGKLALSQSGIAGKAIVIGSYGTGPLPKIQQGSDCVGLTGSYMTVKELQVDNCGFAGFSIAGDSNTVRDSLMTGSVAGAYVKASASATRVLDSELRDNNKMSVNTPAPGDDSGAFGVLLHGSQSEIAGNLISGSDAFSYDYGRDGAAIEVYGGSSNHLHHNLAVDNDTFSELGEAGSADNTFAYNVVRSSLTDSRFLVTRGGAGSRGPVLRTALYNNTVLFTGSTSQGVVCHEGCTNDVLRMRNNVIQAVTKVGYADGPFDEDYDLFWGGAVQFSPGPNSQVADPRFVDPAGWDLGLQALSPAVDSGEAVPGYDRDRAGASVPYDGDGDGLSLTDRGAFEYHP